MKKWIYGALIAAIFAFTPAQAKEKAKAGAVRVYRFDNLDIEGHVKTPHLLHFLKRIRSKFRAFRLPKQNFTKRVLDSKGADFLK